MVNNTTQNTDKEILYAYYRSLVPATNRMVFNRQYEKIVAENPSWTTKQILAALRFAVEHLNMKITSLGIVPYVMEDCRNYYRWLHQVKQEIENHTEETTEHIVRPRKNQKENIFV